MSPLTYSDFKAFLSLKGLFLLTSIQFSCVLLLFCLLLRFREKGLPTQKRKRKNEESKKEKKSKKKKAVEEKAKPNKKARK